MSLHLKQSLQQRLLLAPNITLALEVLRLPNMELQPFLQQHVEENPLLDMNERDEIGDAPTEQPSESEKTPELNLGEDWTAAWSNQNEGEDSQDEEFSSDQRVNPPSLHETLVLQLGCQELAPGQRRLGELLIAQLNEYGYFEGTIEDLAKENKASIDDLEATLRLIQQFEPAGVGARNLRECLMIQLDHAKEQDSLAYGILKDHFSLFVHHRIQAISRAVKTPPEAVEAACQRLKQLNPKPGRIFTRDLPQTIVPDLIIFKREDLFDVELNDQHMPHLAINKMYYRMLRHPDTAPEVKRFLQNKFRQASWVIKAIDERNTTLLAIARCLISLQREFLEHGTKVLKPLTQTQVAQMIGRHASTVSRAIAGKSIDTPHGVLRLEELFATGVPQSMGNAAISDATIKAEIEHLISGENPRRPLSDDRLAQLLKERRIEIARRTIAKYRTELRILPAHLRRRQG